jgi:predicted branched-subunit amino acid permease
MTGRKKLIRDALGIGLGSGAYAISYGALAVAAHLSVWQTMTMSLLMFTGASQFALVAVISGGGGALAAAATAILVGSRNALYGLRMSALLRLRGVRKIVGTQLVIDESTAMALGREDPDAARFSFWATGLAIFVLWNLGSLIGAIGAKSLANPKALGLDAAPPAAFLALLGPRLRSRRQVGVAVFSLILAVGLTPFAPQGVPVLCAAALSGAFVMWRPLAERADRTGAGAASETTS